ncbi:MAG: chorismate synthase [Proteobacteria bacterium]|nr:chorismate synthase [Pseudomonadota bacterium]MBU4296941.1 chorismate synthase [Pseudomonadota bacterium]MCG2746103.1 chorismate synthase [Desulfobulbaceae bacterium]
MAGNTFGQVFRVTTWGESHGAAIGATIDGCPPGIPLTTEHIQADLNRRRPGTGGATSPRKEPDRVEILSGIFEGCTTGTPLTLIIYNQDAHSKSYDHLKDIFRPGHGDYSYLMKYGIRDHRGGGRASARETAARVAAGAVARRLLSFHDIDVFAYTLSLGGIDAENLDFEAVWENRLFCPDNEAAARMEERIEAVKKEGDSLGGIVGIIANGCPPGLGEPVFNKLDADLAGALMSIGAVKGVEIGSGFMAARLTGSQNNDALTPEGFSSNNAGGILAGISNGEPIIARVAVKPIPSISKPQNTVNLDNEQVEIKIGGRHDISAIPRIIPVCEAMVCLTLADHLLRLQTLEWTPESLEMDEL